MKNYIKPSIYFILSGISAFLSGELINTGLVVFFTFESIFLFAIAIGFLVANTRD